MLSISRGSTTAGAAGRLRDALRRALIRAPAGRRLWWRSRGRDHELDYWTWWLEHKGGAAWGEDYARRLAPAPLIEDPLVTAHLDEMDRAEARILDVGAGPVTRLGSRHPGKTVEVVAVDPLADEYDRLLSRFGVEPPVRTVKAHGERLLTQFAPASFDIAYAVNSIDHSYDPLLIIENMLSLVRPDGLVVLRHVHNEGEHQRYVGLHQWNFDVHDGDLVIWNHAVRQSLRQAIGPRGTVAAWIEDGWTLVRVTPSGDRADVNGSSHLETSPTRAPGRVMTALKRVLDALGIVAFAYDARARLRYLLRGEARARNARFSRLHEGLPLPPPMHVYRVAGHFDLQEYYESGRDHAELLRGVLTDNGFELERFRSLLDFGCGCGRVVRHWAELRSTRIHGSDYNPRLVAWCRRALPFAEFRVNGLAPPLGYRSGELDFVYAVSVFTHLSEELQQEWMRELGRVLSPAGVLVLTTKGRSRLGPLDDDERRRFRRGELVVQFPRYEGRNLCAAYHPESYVRERLAAGFEVVDLVPATPDGGQSQDLWLLRKAALR